MIGARANRTRVVGEETEQRRPAGWRITGEGGKGDRRRIGRPIVKGKRLDSGLKSTWAGGVIKRVIRTMLPLKPTPAKAGHVKDLRA